jgi:hypothetical protein
MPRLDISGLAVLLASHTYSANALVARPVGSAFSIDTVVSSSPQSFNPGAELNRLSSKYADITDLTSRQAADSEQHGSLDVTPGSALSFRCPVVIGNQTFPMILDTGSSDL